MTPTRPNMPSKFMHAPSTEQGFTLIELMIALVLTLLISAAAVQIYIISTRTAVMQQSASNMVDSRVYGISRIEQSLRRAGIGLPNTARANHPGGIIMADSRGNTQGIGDVSNIDLTQGRDAAPYDTLTIQYTAPSNMQDCAGNTALGPRLITVEDPHFVAPTTNPNQKPPKISQSVDGQLVVESYFLDTSGNEPVLKCRAGRGTGEYDVMSIDQESPENMALVAPKNTTAPKYVYATGTAGTVYMNPEATLVISGVEMFKVQLGVLSNWQNSNASAQNNSSTAPIEQYGIQYVSINDYITNAQSDTPPPAQPGALPPPPAEEMAAGAPIVSIRFGILVAGSLPALSNDMPENPTHTMFGKPLSVPADAMSARPNHPRRVYESQVMLRNLRGYN